MSADVYTCIENDIFKIYIDEDEGCNIMACFVKKDGALLPLMPDARDESCELDACSFIMLPYSNRIEDGRFSFAGAEHSLQRAEEHSIHGDVRERPWSQVSQSEDALECRFVSADFNDMNWPWAFSVNTRFVLNGACFRSRITLRNDSDTAMPAGFGWHPYFSRALTSADTELRMQLAVDGVYPDTDGNCIPSGPARALTEMENFLEESEVTRLHNLDNCFVGYDGCGTLSWPGTGVRVHFSCSDACGHAVVYTPLEKEFIAFEPVTNANNAVNMFAAGDQGAGVVVLQPGEELTAFMDITVDLDNRS